MVGTDVLRDATGFARGHTRAADVVQQGSLAMVHVAHDRHHRCPGHGHGFRGGVLLFQERLGIIELGRQGFMAHFLHHDHGGFLVELLVDGHHLAQLHHLLDDLGGLHAHLVRQIGHADGFGHMHFLNHGLHGHGGRGTLIAVATAATALGCTPTGTGSGRGVATGLEGALLGRIIGPARRELFALDGLLLTRLGSRRRSSTRGARLGCSLVYRAFDGRLGRLGFFRLLGHHDLLGRVHHRADGRGLRLGSLAALLQVGHTLALGRIGIRCLDHACRRLGGRFRGRGRSR